MKSAPESRQVEPVESDARQDEVLRLIGRVQRSLRQQLLEQVWDDREQLESAIENPEGYFFMFQVYKERYLDKLCDLQRIINEIHALKPKKNR